MFVRRLNMTDIERIAPLEEASMPYHLAETQKQVICYFGPAKPVRHLESSHFIVFLSFVDFLSVRVTGAVPGLCGSRLQSRPTGSPWAPSLEVSSPPSHPPHWSYPTEILVTLNLIWFHSNGSDGRVPHRLGEDPYAEPEVHGILRGRADVQEQLRLCKKSASL